MKMNEKPFSSFSDLKIKRPDTLKSVRYYIMIVGLISPFVITYSRTIINFAIIDMVNPPPISATSPPSTTPTSLQSSSYTPNSVFQVDLDASSTTTTTAFYIEEDTKTSSTLLTSSNNNQQGSKYYFDLDGSCPVNDEDRERLIKNNSNYIERKRTGQTSDRFDWGTFEQGLLKSAYALGHAPFQVPGSRMSEIYGSRRIMSLGTFLIGICCLMAPYLASIHFYLIFLDLILLGSIGSFMTPALINLFTNWLTPGEKSLMMSLYLVASRLGYALSSVLCGLLIDAQYSWRHVFFSAGWCSLIYSTIFFFCARSRPVEHPLIGQLEIDYLANKNRLVKESLVSSGGIRGNESSDKVVSNGNNLELQFYRLKVSWSSNEKNNKKYNNKIVNSQQKAPWFAILTSVPVWAFIVTKFCVKLAGDAVTIELPTYLNKVMHFSPRSNGFINASNYVIFCLSALSVGALGKVALKRRPFGLSKTTLRKCFQCFASFGVSITLVGFAFSACNSAFTQLWLILFFFITTFGIAGEAQIPIDITERYSGTIHAIGSSLAISGVLEPTIVGFFLRGHAADQASWRMVWLVAAAISFMGGVVFLFFADATIQPFDSIYVSDKLSNNIEEAKVGSKEEPHAPTLETIHQTSKLQGLDNKAFYQTEPAEVSIITPEVREFYRHTSQRESKMI